MQAQLDALYAQIEKTLNSESKLDVILLLTSAMKLVEQMQGADGPTKKQLCLSVCKMIIAKRAAPGEKESLTTLLDLLGPAVIDQLCNAANGQLFDRGRAGACCCFRS